MIIYIILGIIFIILIKNIINKKLEENATKQLIEQYRDL